MNKKILRKLFNDEKLDVVFSMARQTRLWYAKVDTSDGWLFIEPKKAHLFVDGRYIEYANHNAKNVKVHLIKNNKTFVDFAQSQKYQYIGIEKDYLTLKEQEFITKLFPRAQLKMIEGQKLRIIKSEDEIKLIHKACQISIKAFNDIKKIITPGVTEQEIDHQLNLKLKKLGATKESFDSIVVSGIRGALPHGKPSSKKLQDGELVTIDFGVQYQGYVSDVTRTLQIGTITNQKLLDIYKIVKKAQQLGIKAIKPGVTTNEIDKICRNYITNQGYGEYFVHSTGHGVGIDVHELPYVSKYAKQNTTLQEGMVVTVEPGIYIEQLGGCRFEDDILVTKDGYKILSK